MIYVGTSGWVYGGWRRLFYPEGVGPRKWLTYYAERFDTVELNATTYRLPKPEQVRLWCEAVPPDFRYTVKLSRLITHRRDLPPKLDRFIENYMNHIACFERGKLAQILVQFPPFLERDDDRLERFLDKLPPLNRYVVEFRHASWFVPEIEALLRRRKIGFAIHDYPRLKVPKWVTSPEVAYVRFHGYAGLYVGSYPRGSLQGWARRLAQLQEEAADVYVYFNNDVDAAAPRDAIELKRILAT